MQKSFYLDTSIWRDYFEDRTDGIKPLGEFAFQFLKKCAANNCIIIYSSITLFELKDFSERLQETSDAFGLALIEAKLSKEQYDEADIAFRQRGLPANDVLHAIISRDNKAILVTRDKHFQELLDIVEPAAPEEITFY